MRTLFELLRARPLNDYVDIESLEKQEDVVLPPIYKLFVQSFYLGEKKIFREQYYNNLYKDYFDCSSYIYTPNEDIGFICFNSIEDSFNIWRSGGLGDMDYELGLFPVGGGDLGISIGLKDELKDKIITSGLVGSKKYETVLCDNIFEFVRGIEVLDINDDFLYGIKYSQLFKNWGDDFWRVREV